jgi:hypothetical protein
VPLNFTPPPFTLSIGGVNFAPLVTELRLQRPKADLATPYTWTGSLKLAHPSEPRFLPETLDDLSNAANRWAKGLYPVVLAVKGKNLVTVRITEYFYDEEEGVAEVQLGDLLTLFNTPSPPKDYKSLGFGDATSLQDLASKALQEAGISSFAVDVPGGLDVAPNKLSGSSYIQFLQQYLGERGYWLYCDPDEVIRVAKYPLETDNIRLVRSRQQIELFKRQRAPQIPAEKFIVTGACERLLKTASAQDDRQVEMGTVGGFQTIVREQTTQVLLDGKHHKRKRIRTRQALGEVFPDAYPNSTTLTTTADTIEDRFYDEQGRLRELKQATDKPYGLALSDFFPNSTAMLSDAELVEETWSESEPGKTLVGGGDGVMRGHVRTVTAYVAAALDRVVTERLTESWSNGTRIGGEPQSERFKYQRSLYQRDDGLDFIGGLKLVDSDEQEDARPPAFEPREADRPTAQVALRGERSFQPVTHTIFKEQEDPYSAQTLQNNAECGNLAALLGTVAHRRYRARLINCPISDDWLNDPSPFPVAHVHNGCYVMEEDTIVLASDGLEVSWIGGFVGSIPALPANPPPDLVLSKPVSPVREIVRVTNGYACHSGVSAKEVFANSAPVSVINRYEYDIQVPERVVNEYNLSARVRERVHVRNTYDYTAGVSPTPVVNTYHYTPVVSDRPVVSVVNTYDYSATVKRPSPLLDNLFFAHKFAGTTEVQQLRDELGISHLTNANAGTIANGEVTFNGGGYLWTPDNPTISTDGSLTIAAAFTVGSRNFQGILSKWSTTAAGSWQILLHPDTTLRFYIGDGGSNFASVGTFVPALNTLYIAIGQYNALTGAISLQLGGVDPESKMASFAMQKSGNALAYGAYSNGGQQMTNGGKILWGCGWTRLLSASEKATLFANTEYPFE